MDSVDVIPVRELRNNYASVAQKLEEHDRIIRDQLRQGAGCADQL